MNICRFATLVLVVAACSPALSADQTPALSHKHETWLNQEVVFIISPAEKDVFGKLTTNRDRDLFIEEFWKQRDPTPGTPQNEFRDEHYRRIIYANERFGGEGSIAGWKTERGRILTTLGPPLEFQKYENPDICPVEIWYYLRDIRPERLTLFRLLFFEAYGAGEYKLYNPVSDGPKSLVPFPERWKGGSAGVAAESARADIPLPAEWTAADIKAHKVLAGSVTGELAEASISSYPGSHDPGDALRFAALLAEIELSLRKRIDDGYAAEFLSRRSGGGVNYSVHRMDNRSRLNVLQDPSGRFLANYIIAPEILTFDYFQDRYFAGLRTQIRVTDAAGTVVFRDDRFSPIELTRDELKTLAENSLELYGDFPLAAGIYTLSLVLENTVSKEFTSTENTISVPDGRLLRMSPLVLAGNVVKDASEGSGRAFQVGTIQLYPSVNNTFQAKDRLILFFQVYGLTPELVEQGRLEYSLMSGEKLLKTSGRNVRDSANRRDFLEEFALDQLAPGTYSVKAALLDKEGREVLSEKAEFIVSAKFPRGAWVVWGPAD